MKNLPLSITRDFSSEADVTLYHGDCLELIRQISESDNKADLIITSPPYNVGKEYETTTSLDDYIERQRETIKACVGILADKGSICWQVGHYIEGSSRAKEAFPLDLVLYPIFKELNLKLRNRIVWYFGHGLHEKYRFSGRHETILWFTHDTEDYTFNLDPVRVPQKYPGKRAYQGKNAGKLSGNPKGKNPSDVWNIPNVKANHVEKTGHPCQFPIALVGRMILATTNENDLVVDPYLGVGSTAAAAVLFGRRCAGSDTEEGYLDIAKERIIAASKDELKFRPLNKPVYKPSQSNSVAQLPEEWKDEQNQSRLFD
jgi:DNA modification methylase